MWTGIIFLINTNIDFFKIFINGLAQLFLGVPMRTLLSIALLFLVLVKSLLPIRNKGHGLA